MGGLVPRKPTCHTPSFTHIIFHTQLRYTQLFIHKRFNSSIIHHLLCLSFHPRPTGKSWKKLTCGVIRSFNFHFLGCGISSRPDPSSHLCQGATQFGDVTTDVSKSTPQGSIDQSLPSIKHTKKIPAECGIYSFWGSFLKVLNDKSANIPACQDETLSTSC